MSTPTESAPAQRPVSLSSIAFWVLVVAALASAPSLLTVLAWALHQPWITIPALLVVALRRWKPKALLTAVLLGRQYVVQRQTKTA